LKNESCETVSIFVVDGKIDKIENSQTINSDDFLTIDLNGKYILPGLWDVHTHIGDLIPDPDNLLETETLPEYTIRAGKNAIDGLKKGITSLRIVGEDGDVCLAWKKMFKKKGF
jgi:imidazolonepropionase-like amidohydrolase